MDALYVRQFTARYHLRKSAGDECERLDNILRTVLDGMLEQALQRAGIPVEEEICIRRLTVPVRLRLSAAGSALARTWSLVLAEAVKQAVDGTLSSDLVRYGSRAHAFIDLAAGVARGNYHRVWAWRQLGMWQGGERPSNAEAMRELVHALSTDSRLILPVFHALADQQLLTPLALRLTFAQWLLLTEAALSATGTALSLLESDELTEPVSSVARQEAHRLIQASPMAEALIATVAASPEVARAAAILMLLATDPSILRTTEKKSRTLVHTVTEALGVIAVVVARQAEVSLPTSPRNLSDSDAAPSWTTEKGEESLTSDVLVGAQRETARTSYAPQSSSLQGEYPIPVIRRRARTRFGGLLFLLGIMEDLGLPDEMCAQPVLNDRLPRWIFHQLALALAPAEADDPAVLAFVGLSPDVSPPSIDEAPPTNEEKQALAAFAARIRDAVCDRLNRQDQQVVMHFLCHRQAEIVADPGWIEVRFSLADVSIEIRRAGFDLNPDYVPWLGIVVKFVYE